MATRRERVVLELQDDFTTGMAKAAAAAALLHKELDALDGSGRRTSTSIDKSSRSTKTLGKDIEDTGRKASTAEKSIDKYSGRLRVLADIGAILAPTIAPVGAAIIPVLSGIAAEFGFAAVGAGTMIVAFQGVGDALKAVNKAALEPTEANLEAAQLAMAQIGPDAQRLVRELQSFEPALKGLRDTAAAGMFPGLISGLDELESRLPDVQLILRNVSDTLGNIAATSGASLASSRWDDFFKFIATDAPPALASMARAAGNTAHALAELWMAFDPLNDDVIAWLEKASNEFDDWAGNLSESKGFHEFIDYVRETGPQVAETFAAVGNAVLQVVEASAPLGGPVLHAIEGVANALAAIANSNAGPTIMAAVTAMALLSRGQAIFASVSERSWVAAIRGADTFGGKLTAARVPLLKSGAALAGLGLASSGLADKFDLTNTASLALIGTLGGPWGAAVGGAVGLALDLGKTHEKVSTDVSALTATLNQQTGAITENTRSWTAHNLEQQGVLKAAAALGLSLGDVTEAALGNGDALDRVNAGLIDAKTGFYNADGTIKVGSDTLRKYGDNMHLVQDAVGGSNKALKDGQDRIQRMADASGQAAGSTEAFAAAQRKSAAALTASRGAARDVAKSFFDISKSADDAKVSLNQWIRQLSQQANALNNFTANTLKAASRGLRQGLIAELQKLGPVGALRMRQLANASDKELGRANAAWDKHTRAVRNSTDAVGGSATAAGSRIAAMRIEIDRLKSKAVKVDEKGAAAARARIQALRGEIARLQGKSITITEIHRNIIATKHANLDKASDANVGADGATVPKTGLPYADRHLYLLADGEEIISNRHGQADQFRADRAAGVIPHYAEGGTTGLYFSDGSERRRRGNDPTPHVNHFAQALREATKSLNKEKAARDRLVSKRNELRSTVSGNFMSDPFANSNVWAAGGGNPTAILKADIAHANQFRASLKKLKGLGLDGNALASIASTGNIGQAQALASLGKSGVGQYESAFNTRARAAAAVGNAAGHLAYGAAIARDNRELTKLNATVHRLEAQLKRQHRESQRNRRHNADHTGKAVGKAINHGASKAKRAAR